jgi:tetratricopeptide (TPR) repeat protein
VLLAVLVSVAIGAFLATRAIARSNDALRSRQAAAWYDAAQHATVAGNTESAVAALRRAVSKDRQNRRYRLVLADALMARRFDDEARRALLALRDAQPEDPEANLRLARLEARGSDADAARRYYQNALSGLWRAEQAEERRRVRTELIEFLLAHDEHGRALSELLLMAANLPEDAAVQARVGRMFLAAGNPRLALDHFERAERLDTDNADALAGAGEAAFQLEDYSRALRYLKRAAPDDTRVMELRDLAQLVLSDDPLAPRLRAGERQRRLMLAVRQALQRLDGCLDVPRAPASLGLLRNDALDLASTLERSRGPVPRDLVDDGVDLVYRAERAAEGTCGTPPALFDRAIVLIGRRHGLEEQ